MKRRQTNVVGKKLLRNLVIATVLIGLNMAYIKASAKTYTPSEEPGDTTKMIAGVPLKAEDISPLLAGEIFRR